jgi:hypothetical protein
MSELYTLDYGNQAIDQISEAIQDQPDTNLVDVRCYPFL